MDLSHNVNPSEDQNGKDNPEAPQATPRVSIIRFVLDLFTKQM